MSHYIIKHIHGEILFFSQEFTSYDLAEQKLEVYILAQELFKTDKDVDRNNYLICSID